MPDPLPDVRAIKFRDHGDKRNFLAWLGRYQERRAKLRAIHPVSRNKRYLSLPSRLVQATFPWTVHNYPGKMVLLGWITGTPEETAGKYLATGRLSPPAAHRAANWLEARIAEYQALVKELRDVPLKETRFQPGSNKHPAPNK